VEGDFFPLVQLRCGTPDIRDNTGDLCSPCPCQAPICAAQKDIFSAFGSAPWIPSAVEPACAAQRNRSFTNHRGEKKMRKMVQFGCSLFALLLPPAAVNQKDPEFGRFSRSSFEWRFSFFLNRSVEQKTGDLMA
jgi:hypothetical protein